MDYLLVFGLTQLEEGRIRASAQDDVFFSVSFVRASFMRLSLLLMSLSGGGGPIAYIYHSKGKPTPPELQGPEFITYAGLTISKPQADFEHYWTKFIGGLVWFTMIYHFSLNWEEHWYGDIYFFERDVQKNGWDDEHGHEAHH